MLRPIDIAAITGAISITLITATCDLDKALELSRIFTEPETGLSEFKNPKVEAPNLPISVERIKAENIHFSKERR